MDLGAILLNAQSPGIVFMFHAFEYNVIIHFIFSIIDNNLRGQAEVFLNDALERQYVCILYKCFNCHLKYLCIHCC